MKRIIGKKILLSIFFLGLSLVGFGKAEALNCPYPIPPERLAWCADESSDHFSDGLCVAFPIGKNQAISNDQIEVEELAELKNDAICLLGKVKSAEVSNLVDFAVDASFVPSPLYDFESSLEIDSPLFIPEIDVFLEPQNSPPNLRGEFVSLLPLLRQGNYNLQIKARFIRNGVLKDVKVVKKILCLSPPHLTVSQAQTGGGGDPIPVSEPSLENPPGSDHSVTLTPPADGFALDSIDLCLDASHGKTADHPSYPGEEISFTATNRITDHSGAQARIAEIKCKPGNGLCNASPGGENFCSTGTVLNIPMGHGTNEIEIAVDNDVGDGQKVSVAPIENDINGPSLCVSYYDEDGQLIPDVDGKVLLPSEESKVTVDVVLGSCGAVPEQVQEVSCGTMIREGRKSSWIRFNPVCSDDWPVCFQRDESETLFKMCPEDVDGKTHFRANLNYLRFPINTVTIHAKDKAGNLSTETHSFNHGNVRALFDKNGVLQVQKAMIPAALGGFLPASFVTGEAKAVALKILNSDKFRKELFPQLLDPHHPGDAERACLRAIEDQVNCAYDHLADENRVVTIKPLQGGNNGFQVGGIEIPSFHLWGDNNIRLQLKVSDLTGRAEMYTIAFQDTDNDGEKDTEDEDDDGDGILDEDESDDDDDGVPDDHDMPGMIAADPDFGTFSIPLRFAMKKLAISVDVHLRKANDGTLAVDILDIPNKPLVEWIPVDTDPLEFDCDTKIASELYDGDGSHDIAMDNEACNSLKSLNDTGFLDAKKRQFQGIAKQFQCTMDALVRCSIPRRLETALKEFENQKVTAIAPELFDKKFHFDLYAPLSSADVSIDSIGIGFSGKGLLLSAGVTPAGSQDEEDASVFLKGFTERLGASKDFPFAKFGPVYEKEVSEEDRVDPIEVAYGMGSEISLALKEETINSLLHAVNIALFDLNSWEPDDKPKFLDLFAKRLREELGGAIKDVGGDVCLDKNGKEVPEDWTCFPFALSLSNLLGEKAVDYIDFDKDGLVAPSIDSQIPVMIRTTLNRFSAPTVRLVDVSAMEGLGDGQPETPDIIFAEFEIGLPPTTMQIFEEEYEIVEVDDPEPQLERSAPREDGPRSRKDPKPEKKSVKRGTGVIKSWCDDDRFRGMDPELCPGGKSPIIEFSVTGRIFVTLLIERGDNGILRIAAGVSTKDGPNGAELDTEKTFLKASVLKNNTIIRNRSSAAEKGLADTFEANLGTILSSYGFGTPRTVKIKIPTMYPFFKDKSHPEVLWFCEKFSDEPNGICDCESNPEGPICDIVAGIEDLWKDLDLEEDFGIHGFELQDPRFSIAGSGVYDEDAEKALESLMSSPRYLTLGIGACLKGADGNCIGSTNNLGRAVQSLRRK